MKRILILMSVMTAVILNAETLFEVKDSSNRKVLDVSTDGLRVMNDGDTLMVISSNEIRANIGENKGLSRSFSVTTTSSVKGKGLTRSLDVGTESASMSSAQGKYTDFSPLNMFLGLNAGTSIDGGKYNVFIGNYSGNTTTGPEEPDMFEYGYYNTFIGYESGRYATSSFYNTYIGANSGRINSNGSDNTFLGSESGAKNTGSNNTFLGAFTGGAYNSSGTSNTFVGCAAGNYTTSGHDNTYLGHGAGENNQTGNDNVYLGRYAGGSNVYGYGNICIGRSAGSQESGSNKLYIDNSNTTTPLIYGDFSTDIIKINGKLQSEDITTANDNPAVFGKHAVTNNYGVGVRGESKWKGVEGYTNNASGNGFALYGNAEGAGTGTRYGVYGTASGGAAAWAGYFEGDVNITGTVTKSKDEVKIDHPLDPVNKYLVHSGVNSDEMINVYNGNIILGKDGTAVVSLPDWFESYNTDFRYQLTPIGAPANLYIAEKIKNNSFKIAGGSPDMEVSWQVTGTRNDNYAKSNPINAETDKESDDKGFYLHPESFGLPIEKGIEYKHQKQMNEGKKD